MIKHFALTEEVETNENVLSGVTLLTFPLDVALLYSRECKSHWTGFSLQVHYSVALLLGPAQNRFRQSFLLPALFIFFIVNTLSIQLR